MNDFRINLLADRIIRATLSYDNRDHPREHADDFADNRIERNIIAFILDAGPDQSFLDDIRPLFLSSPVRFATITASLRPPKRIEYYLADGLKLVQTFVTGDPGHWTKTFIAMSPQGQRQYFADLVNGSLS